MLITSFGGYSRLAAFGFARIETREVTISNAAFHKKRITGVGATTMGETRLGMPLLVGPKTDIKTVVVAGATPTTDHLKTSFSGYLIKHI